MQKRILVIDNDPGILEVMQETLSYQGFYVVVSEGTDDLLALINQHQPDLLILDYRLNGLNGGELCKKVKTNPETQDLPVIIFSAYPKLLQSLDFYGCDDFIAKPFDLSELIEKVSDLLAAHQNTGINTAIFGY